MKPALVFYKRFGLIKNNDIKQPPLNFWIDVTVTKTKVVTNNRVQKVKTPCFVGVFVSQNGK